MVVILAVKEKQITEAGLGVNKQDLYQRKTATREEEQQTLVYAPFVTQIESYEQAKNDYSMKKEDQSNFINNVGGFLAQKAGIPLNQFTISNISMERLNDENSGMTVRTGLIMMTVVKGLDAKSFGPEMFVLFNPKNGQIEVVNPVNNKSLEIKPGFQLQNFYDKTVNLPEKITNKELKEYQNLTGAFVSGEFWGAGEKFALVERSKEPVEIDVYAINQAGEYERVKPELYFKEGKGLVLRYGAFTLKISPLDNNNQLLDIQTIIPEKEKYRD